MVSRKEMRMVEGVRRAAENNNRLRLMWRAAGQYAGVLWTQELYVGYGEESK